MKFKNVHVQEAFKLIAGDEMLMDKPVPNYKLIIKILEVAIKKVHKGKPGKPQFEWLTGECSHGIQLNEIVIQK